MTIGNGTLYDLTIYFVGTPKDDMQELVAYLFAGAIFVLLVFSVVYIFKVIGQVFEKA